MAIALSNLLSAEEPAFTRSIQGLENVSGQVGKDVDLIGEIAQNLSQTKRELGFDPQDTKPKELYQALLARVERDNQRVTKIIGAKDPSDVSDVVPKAIATVEKLDLARDCWVLKRSVAKQLLSKMPPEALMKSLGYRSVTSMLRHEDIDEVYTAIRFSEGDEWLKRYNSLFKTVKPSDFETRQIRIIQMDHDKYVDLAEHFVQKKLHNVTHTKEMGSIVIVPMKVTHMKGMTLKTLPLIIHYINEIRLYSTFFKLKQVSPIFGATVVETLNADSPVASVIGDSPIHWRVIQRYFGKLKSEAHPEAFQPHVHPEDLHWRHAESVLAEIDPEMKFWLEKDYVAELADDKEPLTFNFMDVSLSYANSITFADRYYYHFRESLWNELFMRYMGVRTLEEQVLQQLDNDDIVIENIKR